MIKPIKEILTEKDLKCLEYHSGSDESGFLKKAITENNTVQILLWVNAQVEIVTHGMWLRANEALYKIAQEHPEEFARALGSEHKETLN